jgi:hypothetical protein
MEEHIKQQDAFVVNDEIGDPGIIDMRSEYNKALELGLNAHDYENIKIHGMSVDTIGKHIEIFKNGIPKAILERAATRGDGILVLKPADFEKYAHLFDQQKRHLILEKFVPASGAASRMFKFLSEFLLEYRREEESINAYINRKNATDLKVFLVGLEKFPFYEEVKLRLQKHYSNYITWNSDLRKYYFIKTMLSTKHFDFANKPKAILPFHKYSDFTATPIEEHLNECCLYSSSEGVAKLHFTVTEAHRAAFEKILKKITPIIEAKYRKTIKISFSYQQKYTDTIAVTSDNEPMRNEEGNLIFRPGGHGALIENMNSLDSDIVFIKNIDNVLLNHIETIALYKKALAGILLELQQRVFAYMQLLTSGSVNSKQLSEIVSYARKKLNIAVVEDFEHYSTDHKLTVLKNLLDRPMRVCGMVKNEGEPGGGPFWILDSKGRQSLQIVESSQVDTDNEQQRSIMNSATHFNPVDIVCGLRNYKGDKFDLTKFVDHESGFIVEKTKAGKALKAYELPGLWNGAMAKWITVFVEVPLITFNPVKTVNDLLKPAHQPL